MSEAAPAVPRTLEDLREALAAIEHERWADWNKHLLGKCESEAGYPGPRSLLIPAGYVASLERQIATPYAELSRPEQESDLEQVDRYWPLVVEFVGAWIDAANPIPHISVIAQRWRDEMSAG